MPSIKTVISCIVVTTMLISSGCDTGVDQSAYYKHKDIVKTFFRMSTDEQMAQFNKYNVEEQYAIFIYGNQVVHPSAIHLAEPFAMEGESVVDFLETKLMQTQHDFTICDIVLVFSEMSRLKTYDVAEDKNLMQLINDSVARITNDDWKQITKERVNKIRESSATPNQR